MESAARQAASALAHQLLQENHRQVNLENPEVEYWIGSYPAYKGRPGDRCQHSKMIVTTIKELLMHTRFVPSQTLCAYAL